MSQRMGVLSEWKMLGEGESISLPGRERTIALDVNSASQVGVYANFEGSPEVLVGLVEGRDRLEFTVPGDVSLYANGGELFYKTLDGEVAYVTADPADPIFTRIANRRMRNHNLEMMEYQMRRNLEARMEQMEADAVQRLHDTERQYAASRRPLLGPALPVGEEPAAEGSAGKGKQSSKAAAGKGREDEDQGGAGGKSPKGGKASPGSADD